MPGTPGAKDKEKAPSAATFFLSAANKDTGVGIGALAVAWRLNYDTVGNLLKPSKPHVIAAKRIALKKGSPVRVAWQ